MSFISQAFGWTKIIAFLPSTTSITATPLNVEINSWTPICTAMAPPILKLNVMITLTKIRIERNSAFLFSVIFLAQSTSLAVSLAKEHPNINNSVGKGHREPCNKVASITAEHQLNLEPPTFRP